MSRTVWIRIVLAVVIALAALFLIRMHNAGGAHPPAPRRASFGGGLVQGVPRHRSGNHRGGKARTGLRHGSQPAIDHGAFATSIPSDQPPKHAESHPEPDETDNLINYILSLKRD